MTGEGKGQGRGAERRAAERARLIDAFTRLAAQRGFAQTTVESVAELSGYPAATFRAHFPDRRSCLVAAHDAFFERLLRQVDVAAAAEVAWPDQVRAAVAAAFEFVAETAGPARLFAVEAVGGGPAILERYFGLTERLAARLASGRAIYRCAAELPPATEVVLVGGLASRVTACLLAEDSASLAALEPQVAAIVLAPYLGEDGAAGRRAA